MCGRVAPDPKLGFIAERRSVSRLQHHVVDGDRALDDLNPGMPATGNAMNDLVTRIEKGGVEAHILMNRNGLLSPIR